MPDHIKFLLKHACFGALAAISFCGLLLWQNVMNIAHLVTHSPGGYLALVVMVVFFIITFGSVQMGIAVMRLEERPPHDPPRGPMIPVRAVVGKGDGTTRQP